MNRRWIQPLRPTAAGVRRRSTDSDSAPAGGGRPASARGPGPLAPPCGGLSPSPGRARGPARRVAPGIYSPAAGRRRGSVQTRRRSRLLELKLTPPPGVAPRTSESESGKVTFRVRGRLGGRWRHAGSVRVTVPASKSLYEPVQVCAFGSHSGWHVPGRGDHGNRRRQC